MANDTNTLLRKKLDELRAEKAALDAELLPMREQCNKVHQDIQKLYDTIAPLGAKIRARMPEAQRLDNEIAKLAVALGGRRMSDQQPA